MLFCVRISSPNVMEMEVNSKRPKGVVIAVLRISAEFTDTWGNTFCKSTFENICLSQNMLTKSCKYCRGYLYGIII